MYLLAALTLLSIPTLATKTPCPDENAKKFLAEHKVTTDVTNLLKGKTFIDVWRRKQTADVLNCATTQFTLNGKVLKVEIRNVGKDGSLISYSEIWTEVKGKGHMDASGHYMKDGVAIDPYTEHYNIFYADKYAYGYFSCGFDNDYLRMSISIVKDKQEDAKALVSLGKAKAIMDKFLPSIPEPMVELSRTQCPGSA